METSEKNIYIFFVLTHSEGCLVLPGPSAGAWGMGMDWELTMVRTV